MTIGTQEIFALIIVIAIVGFALFRRLHKKTTAENPCSDCEHKQADSSKEKPVSFFKKQD